MKKNISAMETDTPAQGFLQVNVVNIENNFPIKNATVSISYAGEPEKTIESVSTDNSGQTEQISLSAPPLDYSLQPQDPAQKSSRRLLPSSRYVLSRKQTRSQWKIRL